MYFFRTCTCCETCKKHVFSRFEEIRCHSKREWHSIRDCHYIRGNTVKEENAEVTELTIINHLNGDLHEEAYKPTNSKGKGKEHENAPQRAEEQTATTRMEEDKVVILSSSGSEESSKSKEPCGS
uniref:LIM zinc-binding domain-containing protein n=1 Tax=Meloidogyne hapla TaxID=6305 RepID=A0A1I8B761_MELHA